MKQSVVNYSNATINSLDQSILLASGLNDYGKWLGELNEERERDKIVIETFISKLGKFITIKEPYLPFLRAIPKDQHDQVLELVKRLVKSCFPNIDIRTFLMHYLNTI